MQTSIKTVFAQENDSALYVPLIGLTSIPEPLALPKGAGTVTYNYAVKNFLREVPLSDIHVIDTICRDIKFVSGDSNQDSKLDFDETWRYRCTTTLSQTTHSIATVTGTANDISATHNAYATVNVGSSDQPPLVSIINISKIAYPLSLPAKGGNITFTYKVNNPGAVALSDVTVTDDQCHQMSGKLGDTNGNNQLDTDEVWIYTCTTNLTQTTTNTVHVLALSNGFQAKDDATITVHVDTLPESNPKLPDTGENLSSNNLKELAWGVLSVILGVQILFFFLKRRRK